MDMPKLVSDLNDDDREKLDNKLDAIIKKIGIDEYSTRNGQRPSWLEEFVGICSTCKNLDWAKKEFGGVLAYCNYFTVKMSGRERIIECNHHERVGTMTLNDMKEMAILIDPPERQIGFIPK
jgi:hypothetical protein